MIDALKETFHQKLRLVDPEFEAENLSQYELFLAITESSIELMVVDSLKDKSMYFERFAAGHNVSVTETIEALNELMESHSFLQAAFWKRIVIAHDSPHYTLIPASLFDENFVEHYLPAVRSKEEWDFLHQYITIADMVQVFAVPANLKKWCATQWGMKAIEQVHATRGLLELNFRKGPTSAEEKMELTVENDLIHVLTKKGNRLVSLNSFHWQVPEDIVYFVLFTMEQLGLSAEKTNLVVRGMLDKSSQVFKKLYQYIRYVQIGQRPDFLYYGYVFDELPDAACHPLAGLHLCQKN